MSALRLALGIARALRAFGRWTVALATAHPLRFALLVATVFLLTRGYRLDWPRGMYFDEHYYARSAFEVIAGQEPSTNEHPHLAKYLMALGVLAFGDNRTVAREDLPADVTAITADVNGTIVYAQAGGQVTVRLADGSEAAYGRLPGDARSLALDGRRVLYRTATRVGELFNRAPGDVGERGIDVPEGVRAALALGPWTVVATPREIVLYRPGLVEDKRLAFEGTVAVAARPDFARLFAVNASGTYREFDLASGAVLVEVRTGVRTSAVAYSWSQRQVLLGDRDRPSVWLFDEKERTLREAALPNARVGNLRGGVRALAMDPLTDLAYVALEDGLLAVAPKTGAAFARVVNGPVTWIAVDGAREHVIAARPGELFRVAGRNALAWRIPGLLAGAVLVIFGVLLAQRLFGGAVAAAFAALLLLDGTTFVMPRAGLLDVYAVAGLVAGWYFVVRALRATTARAAARACLFAGLALGLGIASKWSAIPALAGVFLVASWMTVRARLIPGAGGIFDLLGGRGRNALVLGVCFALVPAAVYVASYLPWFGLGHTLDQFLQLQEEILLYHALFAPTPHDLASRWWTWPLLLKPIHAFGAGVLGGQASHIYEIGNPLLFWSGLVALPLALVEAVRLRSGALALVLLAFAAAYIQWALTPRTQYFYYFFAATPFYLLLLAYALVRLAALRRARPIVTGYFVAAALVFAFWYAMLSAVPLPREWQAAYLWLPTWRDACRLEEPIVCGSRVTETDDIPTAVPADSEGRLRSSP